MSSNPALLLMPNIPKPLHGLSPRVIFGRNWWDNQRHSAYQKAGFNCEACGVPKSNALFFKWLEAHERYTINYKQGTMTFIGICALCHACHNYIHSGRLKILLDTKEINEEKYSTIINHGDCILKANNLVKPILPSEIAKWEDWRMIYYGKHYGPSTKNEVEWSQGKWKTYLKTKSS